MESATALPAPSRSKLIIWKNQRGSETILELKSSGKVSGVYFTAVGKGVGHPWPASGFIREKAIAFSVGFERSIAQFNGEINKTDEGQSTESLWQLRSQSEGADDFKQVNSGFDHFKSLKLSFPANEIEHQAYGTIPTTMDIAKAIMQTNIPKGKIYVITAKEQTQGRGQGTNTWVSPLGNLYVNFVFAFQAFPNVQLMSHVASASVAQTLQQLGLSPEVKYVNDVFLNGFKVSGNIALAEHGSDLKLTLGIGINVNTSQEVYEQVPTASSLLIQTGKEHKISQILQMLTLNLLKNTDLLATQGFDPIHAILAPIMRSLGRRVRTYNPADARLQNPLLEGIFAELGRGERAGQALIIQDDGTQNWIFGDRMRDA